VRKTLLGLALLAGVAGAEMPSPSILLDSRAVSIGVVHARPDDTGFKEMLKTAWETMRAREGGGATFLDLISSFLSRATQENILLGFLPFQGVRIDHIDEKGRDRASFMVTAAGWPGIQGLFWNTLLNGPDGKPYPTEAVGRDTLVIRPKVGQAVEDAPAVARKDGTFYSFADVETARRILEKKDLVNPAISTVLAELNQDSDTYGVLINRQQSLYRFLTWVNRRDFETVKQAVGEEKLLKAFEHVEVVTWQGDLVSDDRMDMQVRFRTDNPEQALQLEEVLSTARSALAEKGRTGDLQMTSVDQDVLVDIQFQGYRKMMVDYLQRGSKKS